MADPYDLERFVSAQEPVFPAVRAELAAGAKRSHWMWFVFPQLEGLGTSAMAQRYAISRLDEARAYLAHPVLGPRLRECAALAYRARGRSAQDIFGPVDALKLRSSMTLFACAAPDEPLFAEALEAFFGGVGDPETLKRLGQALET